MGLHSGEGEPIGHDYHGPVVNRCARIMGVAHGGQIVLSSAAQQRLGALPDEVSLLDLGLRRLRGLSSSLESVLWHLRARDALLVLDNCEHLLDEVASLVQALLRNCPKVTVMTTTREALSMPGETVWHVPPRSLTAAQEGSEAERLFIERGREVDASYRPGPIDLAAIGQICRRLDGIPLAIELAAAEPDVIELLCHSIEPEFLLGPLDRTRSRPGEAIQPDQVNVPQRCYLAPLAESLQPIRAHRLKQPIAARGVDLLVDDQRAIRERGQQIKHIVPVHVP